jgi:hypothetical protein
MFASHEVALDAPYEAATARLVHLINWGALHSVSEAAYEGGWQALVRVGPFGNEPGLSKLVRVRVLNPVRRGTTMTVSLRWEATGPAGELFPVLDADLILMREGEARSRLRLLGSYRPPLGRAGAALDRTIMNHVAVATVRSLLDNIADALADPIPYPHQGRDTAPRWRPVTEPGQP